MDKLQELVNIISKWKLSSVNSIGNDSFKSSKAYQLYNAILQGGYTRDEQLKEFVYGDEPASDASFSRLKRRLTNLLVSTVFLQPTENKTDYKTVYKECYKNFAAIKLLMADGAKKSAIDMAQLTLKKAMKYQVTEICYLISKELVKHFALAGDHKQKGHYSELYQLYKKIHLEETEANLMFYEKVSFLLSNWKKQDPEHVEEALSIIDHILNDYESESYVLNQTRYQAGIAQALFNSDYAKVNAICRRALDYYENLPFVPAAGTVFTFLQYKTLALILTAQYPDARKNIVAILKTRKRGGHNWHLTLQHQAILGFYSKDYELARESILQAKRYKNHLSGYMLEHWNIMEAYLYVLHLAGRVQYDGNFRLTRFLNEVPIYSKDKLGANTSIIIAQLLILLLREERDILIDKSDTLRQYIHNYLKGEESLRSNTFIRILRELTISKFDKSTFLERTGEYRQLLKDTPRTITDLETELVPYEDLFEVVVELIQKY